MGDGYDELHDNLLSLEHELSTSVLQGGGAFCGTNLQNYAINGVTHAWRKGSKVKVGIDFDGLGVLTSAQVKETIEACCKEVTDVTDGISYELFVAPFNANLVLKLARLDGPNGVLGDCMIPPPNASTDSTQLTMRIDTGEVWRLMREAMNGAIDFYRFFLHEFGHANGQGHQPTSIRRPAIIQPTYNPSIRNLQDADKEEYIRRYGGRTKPTTPTAPVPTAPAPTGGIQGEIKITLNGETWMAAGPLKKLQPQALYVDRYPTGVVIPPPFVEQDELADTDPIDESELS